MAVNLTMYAHTDVGLVRKSNEDAFVIADLTGGGVLEKQQVACCQVGQRGLLLAVSDGMGGHQAGEVASALVVESLRRSMTSQHDHEPSDALLEKAAVQANHEVWEAAQCPGLQNMGATLTALFVHGSAAYIAEVGDSRAYLLRCGEVAQVTRDQNYGQLLVDTGLMSPTQAKSSAPNVLLQAMGLKPDITVALGKLDLRQRDCLVLCSDGLSNKVNADELRNVILTSPSLDAAGSSLIDLAKRRGGEDNITAVLAGVSGDDVPPLVSGESIAETLVVLREFQARH